MADFQGFAGVFPAATPLLAGRTQLLATAASAALSGPGSGTRYLLVMHDLALTDIPLTITFGIGTATAATPTSAAASTFTGLPLTIEQGKPQLFDAGEFAKLQSVKFFNANASAKNIYLAWFN